MLKKSINYTQSDLKTAYQIVTADLFNSLLQAQDQQSIKLGTLGKLTKLEKQQKCGWDQQNYVYCSLKFKPFTKLKQALNEQIVKKYQLR